MSLGLPSHLARVANSRALATAARWAGLVCLASAFVNVTVAGFGAAGAFSWVGLLVLLPMVGLLVLLARGRTLALTVAYLVVGALSTYVYVLILLTTTPSYTDTNLFVVALPVIAMTLVGGAGTGSLTGILWSTVGFALAEVAVMLAASNAGRVFRPDAISLGAYLLFVGVLAFDGITRGTRSRTQSAIHRSVRDARLIDLRRDVIAEYAADLHDTVLSELLAVAAATPGPLAPRLRARIEADLASLGGAVPGVPRAAGAAGAAARDVEGGPEAGERGDGASDTSGAGSASQGGDSLAGGGGLEAHHAHPRGDGTTGDVWLGSELHRAVESARDEGLAVSISGDRDVIGRLSEERRRAVGLAVRQCLVNVVRHSGSATAEVTLSSSGDSVSVMVVDEGHGFVPSAAAADRLGLRQSVHDRIGRVGGAVTIYSSEDVGTTVLIVVPAGDEEAAG
ncbi:sensor histidine kinase [Leifsonia sp. PS1209]|uniref:sensor histidine kinase n=2 Tax=unclassified Leifsonia TaxID=2663824 RepID=UPI001442D6F6|nr:sensor histidine kinase [Leifsonia sp. PS1209]QIZ97848.1 ATP-binding protein [Leifsonia sp. PS1209]